MESQKVESKRSLSNYFPPVADLTKRSAAYAVTSVLTGRINPVIITSSLFNAVTVSFAKQIAAAESNSTKELIVTVLSLAGSTLVFSFAAAPLFGRIADVTAGTMLKLGFFNAIGEAALHYAIPYIMGKASVPKLPASIEDVKALSEDGVLYVRDHFEDYKEMLENNEMMKAFVDRLSQAEALPEKPKTVKEIEDMNVFAVHYAFDNYQAFVATLPKCESAIDLIKALHTRFYQQDLPLPGRQTIKGNVDAKQHQPIVAVEVPKSTKEVEELSDNQLAWVYAGIANDYEKLMSSMPIAVQVELNKRFQQAFNIQFYHLPTIENIKDIIPEHVKILHDEFLNYEDFFWLDFRTLPNALKNVLNAKFKEHPKCGKLKNNFDKLDLNCTPLNPTNYEDQCKIFVYHRYYSNNLRNWNTLDKSDQERWNQLFSDVHIRKPALPVKN